MAEPGRRAYRDTATLALWTQRLLWGLAALSLLAILFVWLRGFEPKEVGAAEAVLLIVQTLVFAVTAVVTLRWIYLANANARALGAEDMMVSPGWAVGWFFVPLMNLVMPFVMMRELWKASARPKDWQMESAPAPILLWWILWIASGIAGAVGFSLSLEPGAVEGGAAEIAYFLSDLCLIPSLLLLAWIIGRLQAMQSRAIPDAVFA
jgi:hypothetical protein